MNLRKRKMISVVRIMSHFNIMLVKNIYYYIDESGDLSPVEEGGSKVFIVGCAIISNLEGNRDHIQQLRKDLNNSAFFERHKKNKYFHACEDHFDIYMRYVEMLNSLDFRAYAVVINKKSEYFDNLVRNKTQKEVYENLIFQLLYNRLLDRKLNNHYLIFERLGDKLNSEKEEKEKIICNINKELKDRALIDSDLNYNVDVKDKEEELLSIIDYVVHIIGRLYEGKGGKVEKYMEHNFRLIEPKIALISDLVRSKYFNPRKELIDINELYINN